MPDDAGPDRADEELDRHRREIEALDRRILSLVSERIDVARRIGRLKDALGVPLRNFGMEAEVHARLENESRARGLEPTVGHDLARFLIAKAVEGQARQRDAAYAGDALDTIVVGGKGGMGRWVARFLAGQGHRVRIVDPAPAATRFAEAPALDAVADADLVVLAVPMSGCAALLDELAALRPRGVVAEMCSLKGHLGPALSRARAAGVRAVSFHPMFGPDVRMLEGRTIVFCTDAEPGDLAVARGVFAETSARLVEMDPSEHDRRMALVLGLSHLSNLVFARAILHAGVAVDDLVEVAGVTFGRQLATTRQVASENPGLYFQIQALNETTPEIGRCMREALDEWTRAAVVEDEAEFARLMTECREFLGGA